jgi:hypothetical protein
MKKEALLKNIIKRESSKKSMEVMEDDEDFKLDTSFNNGDNNVNIVLGSNISGRSSVVSSPSLRLNDLNADNVVNENEKLNDEEEEENNKEPDMSKFYFTYDYEVYFVL